MVNGVATVWLPVDDMDRAVRFYVDKLGLELKKQYEQWSELDANGLTVGLNSREATTSGDGGGAVLTFEPGGVFFDEVVRLTEAGVHFVDEVSQHPWGRIASFKDTEGNDLQLYEPPPE